MKYVRNPTSYLLRLSYNVYWLRGHLSTLAGTCIMHLNILRTSSDYNQNW